MPIRSNIIAFSVIFLNIICPFLAQAMSCKNLIVPGFYQQKFFEREKSPKKGNYKNDADFLKAYLTNSVVSSTRNFFSKRWDTQVYFSAPGTFPVNKAPELSLVDKNSRGVFIWIHGSGTVKSGGRNYFSNMSVMSNLGFSNVSIDLPFHSNGPTKDQYRDADYTIAWLKRIIEDVKSAGKPVYLVGHSFGPDIISEVVSRYPFLVDGFVGLSPVGFNKTLEDWYEKYTSKMQFGGDVMSSELAGIWAAMVSQQFGWNHGRYSDPTIVNPNLRARFLTGNMEEYVPAPIGGPSKTPIGKNTYDIVEPLRQFFKNATIVVEDGVGHFIFDHKDANGDNAILREVLAVAGYTPKKEHEGKLSKLVQQLTFDTDRMSHTRSNAERVADLYQGDSLFKMWLDETYGQKGDARNLITKMINQDNNVLAKKMLDEYVLARKEREKQMIETLKNTAITHPAYYAANKEKIEKGDLTLLPSFALYAYGIAISP